MAKATDRQQRLAEALKRFKKVRLEGLAPTPASGMQQEDHLDRQTHRTLKTTYAKLCLWLLVAQLAIMNAVLILAGCGCLEYERWTIELYMTGTLAEVFLVVRLIVKHLFPQQRMR